MNKNGKIKYKQDFYQIGFSYLTITPKVTVQGIPSFHYITISTILLKKTALLGELCNVEILCFLSFLLNILFNF